VRLPVASLSSIIAFIRPSARLRPSVHPSSPPSVASHPFSQACPLSFSLPLLSATSPPPPRICSRPSSLRTLFRESSRWPGAGRPSRPGPRQSPKACARPSGSPPARPHLRGPRSAVCGLSVESRPAPGPASAWPGRMSRPREPPPPPVPSHTPPPSHCRARWRAVSSSTRGEAAPTRPGRQVLCEGGAGRWGSSAGIPLLAAGSSSCPGDGRAGGWAGGGGRKPPSSQRVREKRGGIPRLVAGLLVRALPRAGPLYQVASAAARRQPPVWH
jgi:hypothetical protein